MRSDGPAPAHSIAIGVPSLDETFEIDVCAWPAAAMVPKHNTSRTIVRIDTPGQIDNCVKV